MSAEETARALIAAARCLEAASHLVMIVDDENIDPYPIRELVDRGISLASFAGECGRVPVRQ